MTIKGDLVTEAYELIGFDDIDSGLKTKGVKILERMMYVWYNQFIDTGYTFAVPPIAPLPTDESDLVAMTEDAVIMNLALKLASVSGIVAGGTLAADAKTAKDNLYQLTPTPTAQNPFMPVGAGSTRNNGRVTYQGEGDLVTPLGYGGIPLEG